MMKANNAPYDAQASTNYKEAFALFDKRGTQRVQTDSLGDLLRACGQNPTLAEIRDLEKGLGGDCTFSLHVSFLPYFLLYIFHSFPIPQKTWQRNPANHSITSFFGWL